MKKMLNEFKAFINKGNVLDMAIGVIIATAFGAITTSLINNILMPLIGLIFGGIDLSKLDILLSPEVVDEAGEVVKEASYLGLGTFITAIINFIVIAFVVFLIVKAMNKVNDILMPIIGAIFGGSSLKDSLNITLQPAVLDEAGEVVKEANVLGLGNLITFIIDFIIVAFICFLIVKAFNKAKDKAEAKKKAEEAAAAAKAAEEEAAKPKAPTTEELLTEIRDLLAKK